MGYTHYFEQDKAIPTEQWDSITTAFNQLRAHQLLTGESVPIQHESDDPRPPVVNDGYIRFNGVGESGHETFLLKRDSQGEPFSFCKTAHKPYDLVVCATLLLVHHLAPGCYHITSDGEDYLWQPALDLVREVLNQPDLPHIPTV